MNWVPCKVRLPTEADADKNGCVVLEYCDGVRSLCLWERVHRLDVAWLALPEYVPIPDPPDGYEILADYDAEPHPDAMFWSGNNAVWERRAYPERTYSDVENLIYAVPITPPEPQYRPFANAEEFRPFRERWWKMKKSVKEHPPCSFDDGGYSAWSWHGAFRVLEFADCTPFGMSIGGDE